MNEAHFRPGFRLSVFDGVILLAGLIGGLVVGRQAWWAGATVGFVVLHFFLFCNVFRIPRVPELIWATVFVLLAGSTILFEVPGWGMAFGLSLVCSAALIWRATKRQDYHGLLWERWNPGLREWWEEQVGSR